MHNTLKAQSSWLSGHHVEICMQTSKFLIRFALDLVLCMVDASRTSLGHIKCCGNQFKCLRHTRQIASQPFQPFLLYQTFRTNPLGEIFRAYVAQWLIHNGACGPLVWQSTSQVKNYSERAFTHALLHCCWGQQEAIAKPHGVGIKPQST